jgi:4-hydroxy-L-threonine phosphate dehydrogenase PdxA
VTAKALAREEVWDCCRPLVVGDAGVLDRATVLVGGALAFHPISHASEARFDRSAPDLLDLRNVDLASLQSGQVSAAAGKASVEYVQRAVEIARAGWPNAMVAELPAIERKCTSNRRWGASHRRYSSHVFKSRLWLYLASCRKKAPRRLGSPPGAL